MGVAIPGISNLGFTGAKRIGGSVLLAKNNPNACHIWRDMGGVADGNRRTWTFSAWVKRNTLSAGTKQIIFSHGSTSNGEGYIGFDTDDKIELGNDGQANFVDTDSVYRDTFGWYHIIWAVDSTQSSNDDRWKLYINGILVPASDYGSPSITQNGDGYIQCYDSEGMNIAVGDRQRGIESGGDDPYPFDGQVTDAYFIDGQQLAPSNFGFTDPLTGEWRPRKYKDTVNCEDATGANTILNTGSSGKVLTSGNRTDSTGGTSSVKLPMNGSNTGTTFTDVTGKTATAHGTAQTSTTKSRFYGSSGKFDGNSDYISYSNSADFAFGTGDFTVECWLNSPRDTGTYQNVINTRGAAGVTTGWTFSIESNGKIGFYSNGHQLTENGLINANQWHHIACTRNGTVIRMFVDGKQVSLGSCSQDFTNQSLTLGIHNDASGNGWYSGYMQDVRLYKGVCKYRSNFSPPGALKSTRYGTYGWHLPCDGSAPLGSDQSGNSLDFISYNFCGSATLDKATGALPIFNTVCGGNHATVGVRTDPDAPGQLVLAIPYAGIATDVSQFINGGTTGTPITVAGATTNENARGNFYANTLYFDGSNDKVTLPSDAQFDFGTGDFTIEGWFYPTDLSHHRHLPLIQNGDASSNNNFDWRLYFNNHGSGSSVIWAEFACSGTAVALESKTIVVTNEWHHVACTRKSNVFYLYINGQLEDTDSSTTNAIDTDVGTLIEMGFNDLGSANDVWFKGYYQDWRIYKGVAKYTDHFIPASAFPSILADSPSGAIRPTKLATTTKGSICVDSISEHIQVADHADLDMGSSDHCIECWVYPEIASQSNYGCIMSKGAPYQLFYKQDVDGLSLFVENADGSGSGYAVYQNNIPANMAERQWYHVAVTRSSSTWRVFVDGRIKWTGTTSDDVKDTATALSIGTYNAGGSYELGGFISNFRIVKGSAVYTAAFDPPTEPLTAITNTKLLCCQDYRSPISAAVTPSTVSASGGVSATNFNPFDSDINIVQGEPGNYATINDNEPWYNLTIARGALRVYSSSSDRHVRANFRMPEWGKWYWEMKADTVAAAGYLATGLYYRTGSLGASAIATAQGRYITASGLKGGAGGASSSYGGGFDDGDWVSIAVDMDAGKIFAAINGRWCESSNPVTGANAMYDDLRTAYDDMDWYPCCQQWQAGNVGYFNFGQTPFRYTPPKGFQPLNTNALGAQNTDANREPGVPRSDNAFKVLNYSGTGATQRITGLNFQPDLVMLKKYSGGSDRSWQTYDAVRGATILMHNDVNNDDQTQSAGLTAFNRDGFTLSTDDGCNGSTSSPKYMAYCWKAGGGGGTTGGEFWKDSIKYASASAAGMDGGDITPTGVSVGTQQGFSIVGYTGNGSNNQTISHGLGRTPGFCIIKNRDEDVEWIVKHKSNTSNKIFYMDLNDGEDGATGTNHGIPADFSGTSLITVKTSSSNYNNVNKSGVKYIMYTWAEIPGLSKFGEYTGNDNDRGIFTNIGFRPELLIIKKKSAADNWCIMHNATAMNDFATGCMCDHHLRFDTNAMDNSPGGSPPVAIDLLSNGFVHRENSGQVNDSGTFVYMAWSKSPLNSLYGGQAIAR